MNRGLQNLLEEVRQDLGRAETTVARLRQVESYLAEKLRGQNVSAAASEQQAVTNGVEHDLTQAAAAEHVLRETGRPLNTNDLVEAIVRRGLYREHGDRKQLINSIYSAMRRSPRFVKSGRGIWSLAEWEDRQR